VSVVVGNVTIDFLDQVAHIAKGVPADGLLANKREPALHLVEPAGIGGCVVEVKAPMADEPGFDPRMLVRRIIVGD